MSQKIVVLGVGGHGWESLSSVISESTGEVVLYGTTVDWGGFTGSWGRLLEMHDNKLNTLLHGIAVPVLPFGDFNKIITWFIERKLGTDIASVLNYRSYSIDGHFEHFLKLIQPFNLGINQVSGYLTYLQTFFDYLEQYNDELNYSKEPCLSTIFHSFIAGVVGIKQINEFYHQSDIIPKRISLQFSSSVRQVLIGSTEYGSFVGEDVIDSLQTPALPATLQIVDTDLENCSLVGDMLSDIISADIVLIPNGSIANWLPLLNRVEIASLLREKQNQLYCMLNLFYTRNEFPINTYIQFLTTLDIFPHVVLPQIGLPTVSTNTIQRYKLEGKTINYPEFLQKVVDALQDSSRCISVDCTQTPSFKYNPQSVAEKILSRLAL